MTRGEKLREARKRLGWSQTELAQRLGVIGQQISKWEGDGSMSKTTIKIIDDFLENQPQAMIVEKTVMTVSGETQTNVQALEVEIKYLKKMLADKDELIREIRSHYGGKNEEENPDKRKNHLG